MSKFLKENCLCCGTNSLKKKISFENSDLYICKNSCIFSIPKIDTNSIYTPEYFKSFYEDETIAFQKKNASQVNLSFKKILK